MGWTRWPGFRVGSGLFRFEFPALARHGPANWGTKPPATALLGMRSILFLVGAYAILNYFEANVLAALAGCFVAVSAVVLEVLLELIYGT